MELENIDQLPVFDEESTANMRSMLGDEFDQIVNEFIDTTPPLIEALSLAIEQGDKEQIIGVSHRLKSGSANLGMMAFSTVCKYIEENMRNGDDVDLHHSLSLLVQQFARIKSH